MGCSFKATCNDCRLDFDASEGGGLLSSTCCDVIAVASPSPSALTRSVSRTFSISRVFLVRIVSTRQRATRSSVSRIPANRSQRNNTIEAVERLAGKCQCEGQFQFDAPIRCPRCRSSRIEHGEINIMYD